MVGAVLACAAGCFFLVAVLGKPALMVTLLPVLVIAGHYGKWYGIGAAITAVTFNSLLVIFATDSTWLEWFKSGGAFGNIAFIGVVLLVGWLQQALRNVSDSEKALSAANIGIRRLADDNEELSAISNSRLIAEENRAEELDVIDEVTRIITSISDIEGVYLKFFKQLKRIVHFDLAAVVLLNEKSGLIDAGYLSDPDRAFSRKGDSIELAGIGFSGLLEERSTVIVDDLTSSNFGGVRTKKEQNEFLSVMQTPLSSEEIVFGGLILFSRQVESFTQRERTIVERLSAQIASATRKYMASRREEQLLIALDSIGEAVAFLDSDSVYQHVNREFERLYGYSEDEITGQPVSVIPIRDAEAGIQTRNIIEQGSSSVWSGEVVRRAKSGELLDILLTVAPVKNDNGDVIGRVSISRNITERKRTEARLNETSRLASVGELAAGVAHEINNPLTNILLCSEYLADSDLPEEALADLRTITDSALRAAKIVQNLLLFARHKGWDPAPLPMTAVLDRALELKSYDFKIRSIKVRLDFPHEIPCSLIDDHQMTQVIVNVLNNAEQALTTHRNGGVIRIRVSVADGQILTAITDDGPGISAEILPKIFDPFFTTKPAGEGTGLGLSICYGIVQQHGGEMWAESALHRNTTIYIRLPITEKTPAAIPTDESLMTSSVEIDRLLVVDDESSIREMVSKGLDKEFDRIDIAESGEEALEKVRSEDYSCILLDLRLNGIGGPEVYRQIADHDQEIARKIIFITGDTASSATRSFLASVGNVVIPKPFTLRQIRDGISAIR